ncbi:MAG: CvpA family protein [Treponema sp.]|jgi:membrane protein required for colicin V production|nr:CvpA family protein [Treponema sp.]
MNIAAIDIIFIALGLILIIRCALRGFIEELMSMASVVLGLLGGIVFYRSGAVFIREKFLDVKILPEMLAFIALFLIVFVAVKILEYILRDIILRINLGGVDRFLGIIFGMGEGILLICVVLFLLSVQPLFDPVPLLERSFFARLFMPLVGTVSRLVIPGEL